MTPKQQCTDLRNESARLLKWQREPLASLHEQIGNMTIDAYTRDEGGNQLKQVGDRSPLRDLMIDDVIRPINPELYQPTPASAQYADDWNATNALHDEAWDRYTRHHDVAQYRRDCADIRGRD